MSRKGPRSRKNGKLCVGRHRTQCAASSDAQERAIETTERQNAQREIDEQIEDMDPQERGTWAAINSWWG